MAVFLVVPLLFCAPFLPAVSEQADALCRGWALARQCAHAQRVEWSYMQDDDGNERYIVTIHKPKKPYSFGAWLLKAKDGHQRK